MAYLLIILYILILLFKKRFDWHIDFNLGRYLKKAHYLTLGLLLFSCTTYLAFHIQLRGAWTTTILLYTCLLTGTLLALVANQDFLGKAEVFYFSLLRYLQIVFWMVSFVPYLGWYLMLMAFDTLVPRQQAFYSDAHIRIQNTAGIGWRQPQVEIVRYRGLLFEQLFYADKQGYKAYRPSNRAKVTYYPDATHILVWSHYEDYKSPYSHKYVLKNIDAAIDIHDNYSATYSFEGEED